MSRGPWIYQTPRTATVGKLNDAARQRLEVRWAKALADPETWWVEQIQAAATATNRSTSDVIQNWRT